MSPATSTPLPRDKAENLIKCLINEYLEQKDDKEALLSMDNGMPKEQAGETAARVVRSLGGVEGEVS